MSIFTQIPERSRRDSLRPIAVLRSEPPELAQRFTLSFEPGRGRFADSDAALVQLASGQQFMLVHHRDDPMGGTELLASESSPRPAEDLRAFLTAFEIAGREVRWALAGGPRDRVV